MYVLVSAEYRLILTLYLENFNNKTQHNFYMRTHTYSIFECYMKMNQLNEFLRVYINEMNVYVFVRAMLSAGWDCFIAIVFFFYYQLLANEYNFG